MHRRHIFILAAALAAAPLLSGCGPRWIVLTQAAPNPLINQNKFAVLPVDYTGLTVGQKTEADYLSEKDEDTRSKWDGDKEGLNTEFLKVFTERAASNGINIVKATGPADAPFVIRPKVEFIEPGYYALVSKRPSEVRMKVQITAADGKIIDEITLRHGTDGSITNPAVGNRLRDDGEGLGAIMADYLKTRVMGAQ